MRREVAAHAELVLADGRRTPIVGTISIGRAPGNTLRLADPGVSGRHAIVRAIDGRTEVVDAGSRYGTWLDGRRVDGPAVLSDGATLLLGTAVLTVELAGATADRTVVVGGAAAAGEPGAARPLLRPGTALKRLDERRWLLQHPSSGAALRMGDAEAALVGLLDGTRGMAELIRAARRRHGPAGPGRLAQMLASLAERDLLAGVPAAPPAASRRARMLEPRDHVIPGGPAAIAAIHRRGGRLLLTPPGLAVAATVAAAGLLAFALLLATGAVQPFSVAGRYWLGGAVFVAGRLALATLHELAHGLVLASFGRSVRAIGLKIVLIFPYAFVDASEAWREPRRRRIAVSLAGPACDLTLGGACAIAAALLDGAAAQVAFQLALAAYVGALYNLNPLLDRDGYHVLVDLLEEPNLRRRARERLLGLRRPGARPARDRLLLGFGVAVWCWSLLGAAFAAVVLRSALAPLGPVATWTAAALAGALLAAPALLLVVKALAVRRAPEGRTTS